MISKSQDVVVALKLFLGGSDSSYAKLGKALKISASEVHAAVRRLTEARLIDPESRRVRRAPLRDFLIHGVPYAYPAKLKEMTRGVPTAWAAPIMAGKVVASDPAPPVWPAFDGKILGLAVEPLYRFVPQAARFDARLYDLLALVDAIRLGRARERSFAEKELTRILSADGDS
jgi:DNA-binding Lrp family transcriptional regulator